MTRRMTRGERWTIFVLIVVGAVGQTIIVETWGHVVWATTVRAVWLLGTAVACLYINERSTYDSPFYIEVKEKSHAEDRP